MEELEQEFEFCASKLKKILEKVGDREQRKSQEAVGDEELAKSAVATK